MPRIRSMQRCAAISAMSVLALAITVAPSDAATCGTGTFDSTFELIQKVVFENHGCTNNLCHGTAASGGLSLEPEHAYANLVDVAAQSVPGWLRVRTGEKDHSLLWLNLAAKTLPNDYHAPLRAMPLDPVPPLTEDELELVRRWIEIGAPREGVVAGTADLVDACLPPPKPLEITPLPPPAPGTGVQIHMPRWVLPAKSENEVCFASYYDVTDQVPVELRQPNGTFRYKSYEMRQDPLSHHLIVNRYSGSALPTDPEWGPYRCRGGALDGQTCDPLELDACGEGSGCATDFTRTFACFGFGPPGMPGMPSGFNGGLLVSQQTVDALAYADGVYSELPLKGMLKWNSHAFNLTDSDGKLEGWINFEFAKPEEQRTPSQRIFNVSKLFGMYVPAFSTQEICGVQVLPSNAHVYELTSHTHKRGKRFRTFLGAWRCQGGRKNNDPCSPLGSDFDSPDLCAGAPCVATERVPFGDCDGDGAVTVDEVITAVNVALGEAPIARCADGDGDGDNQVSVDEIVVALNAALGDPPARRVRDPRESLLYVNLVYNDPLQLHFDPPLVLRGSSASDLSLTYCSLFDNGFTNPAEVKLKSASPVPPLAGAGGPCSPATHCTVGKVGQTCTGGTPEERDASCDSASGSSDGICDACPLGGGETTEDEMDILMGAFYVPAAGVGE